MVKRRKFLKGLGAGALGTSLASTVSGNKNTRDGYTFNIHFWQTNAVKEKNWDYDPFNELLKPYGETSIAYDDYEPLRVAQNWFEETFNRYVKGYNVETTIHKDAPTMYPDDDDGAYPTEQDFGNGQENVKCPVHPEERHNYDSPIRYFSDWLEANHPDLNPDVHVVLSAAHWMGGLTWHETERDPWENGDWDPDHDHRHKNNMKRTSICWVYGGPYLPNLKDVGYERYQPIDADDPINNAFLTAHNINHEIGHGLIRDTLNENEVYDHATGAVTNSKDNEYYWVTSMGLDGGTYNPVCENDYSEQIPEDGERLWDLSWSDCCIDEWSTGDDRLIRNGYCDLDPLVKEYDFDRSCSIEGDENIDEDTDHERDELREAIQDWSSGHLTDEQLQKIIRAWSGGPVE